MEGEYRLLMQREWQRHRGRTTATGEEEEDEAPESPVDEGSIDINTVTQRLSRKLSLRPDALDLKQRNILKRMGVCVHVCVRTMSRG